MKYGIWNENSETVIIAKYSDGPKLAIVARWTLICATSGRCLDTPGYHLRVGLVE